MKKLTILLTFLPSILLASTMPIPRDGRIKPINQPNDGIASEANLLFKKLENLYNASQTPYPVETSTIKSINSKSNFEGCTMTSAVATYNFPGTLFLRTEDTVKPGHGPLSPAEKIFSIALLNSPDIESFLESEGVTLKNGVINLDNARSNALLEPGCDDGTTFKEARTLSVVGPSSDRTSYDLAAACKTKMATLVSFKKSGSYMIAKQIDYRVNEIAYIYCWPANTKPLQ